MEECLAQVLEISWRAVQEHLQLSPGNALDHKSVVGLNG